MLLLRSFQFVLYEVFPLSANPQFILTASLVVNNPFQHTGFWFAGDYVLIHERFELTVWHIVEDRWAKFDTSQGASQVRTVVLHNRHNTEIILARFL